MPVSDVSFALLRRETPRTPASKAVIGAVGSGLKIVSESATTPLAMPKESTMLKSILTTVVRSLRGKSFEKHDRRRCHVMEKEEEEREGSEEASSEEAIRNETSRPFERRQQEQEGTGRRRWQSCG